MEHLWQSWSSHRWRTACADTVSGHCAKSDHRHATISAHPKGGQEQRALTLLEPTQPQDNRRRNSLQLALLLLLLLLLLPAAYCCCWIITIFAVVTPQR